MPKPIETLLSLPRVRLVDRVPILETEDYVKRFMSHTEYAPKLINSALQVSKSAAQQFSADDQGLSAMLEKIDSAEYIVTRQSRGVMEELLNGICSDGRIYKGFEQEIEPLCDASPPLRYISKLADNLADKAKEESMDLARALLIDLPTHTHQPPHDHSSDTKLK
jgi:hypothetical protein